VLHAFCIAKLTSALLAVPNGSQCKTCSPTSMLVLHSRRLQAPGMVSLCRTASSGPRLNKNKCVRPIILGQYLIDAFPWPETRAFSDRRNVVHRHFCPEWFFGNISKIELDTLSNKWTALISLCKTQKIDHYVQPCPPLRVEIDTS